MYDPDTQAILDRMQNRNRTPIQKGANAIGRFGALLTGHKPEQEDGASRLANQMALMQFKSTLPGNDKPNFLLGEDGQLKPLPTGRIVQQPFGLSNTAEKRFQGRQEESSANRDAGMVKAGFLPENQVSDDNGQTQVDVGGKNYTLSNDLAQQKAEQEKLKKTIPDSDKDTLSSLGNSIGIMGAIKDKAGPMGVSPMSLRYGTSPIANEYGKYTLNPEQSQFKADLTEAVNQYLKAQTGVQRGFKEISFLSSALPEGRQKPENFTANAEAVIGRSIMQMEHIVDALKKSGYDTTQFEGDVQKYKEQYSQYVTRYESQKPAQEQQQVGQSTQSTQLSDEEAYAKYQALKGRR